jgi:hypothetical protein
MARDAPQAQQPDCHEPDRHDRAEGAADPGRALRLDREQHNENGDRDRQHIRRKTRKSDVEPFQRG